MTLFRLTYKRGGKVCACTFEAADLVSAMDFYELWERMNPQIREIEMQALRPSRFGARLVGGAESIV